MGARELVDELIERIARLDTEQQKELLQLVKQWQAGQQRRYERFEQQVDIGVGYQGRMARGRAKDLSAGGIYIVVDADFAPTETVDLVFSLPGAERPFKLKGRVVRLSRDGIAVEFEQVTSYFAQTLDDTLRTISAQ